MNILPILFIFLNFSSCSAQEATSTYSFPKDFQWCVATAAHQIEGNNIYSDWWEFEKEKGRIKNNETSGLACNHWNRLEEDTRLLKDLGVNTYRLSIEWAKIEPREGEIDKDAIEHYLKEFRLLKGNSIQPIVTLSHTTIPTWLEKKGGWEWEGTPQAFDRFTEIAYEKFGAYIETWFTLNEPLTIIVAGYLGDVFPPAVKDPKRIEKPFVGMLRAHALAYKRLHELAKKSNRKVKVGIAHHLRIFDADNPVNPLDQVGAFLFNDAFNWAFFNAIESGTVTVNIPGLVTFQQTIPGLAGSQDFIGFNYYSRSRVAFNWNTESKMELKVTAGAPVTDIGWEIYPEGFYRLLKELSGRVPNKEILIAENGLADSKDEKREKFIRDHLKVLHRAIQEGMKISGYCHWAPYDNFEWAEGTSARFGLYETNYKTFEKKPRPSAEFFQKLTRENKFTEVNEVK